MSATATVHDESLHPRDPQGKFATKPASEADVALTTPARAQMTREDYAHLSSEYGRFSQGYTDEDINAVLDNLEGAEMVCVWDRAEGDYFTGDSEIVGRVGDGPWRRIHPELWNHLTGEDDTLDGGFCTECGAECVVEEDGTSHHLDEDGSVDYNADADHVALDESLTERPNGASPVLDPATPLLEDEPYELQDLDDLDRSGANIAIESDYDEDVCECGPRWTTVRASTGCAATAPTGPRTRS